MRCQAVDSLRGYAYQALEAALAWLDINEKDRLFLEVAEDYAIVAEQALQAVQVKDTERSGSVTLNSPSIHKAVAAFVDLVERNPDIQVSLRFFTTSKIGIEQAIDDRPAGMAGIGVLAKSRRWSGPVTAARNIGERQIPGICKNLLQGSRGRGAP